MSLLGWIALAVAAGVAIAFLWMGVMNVAGWDNDDDQGNPLP